MADIYDYDYDAHTQPGDMSYDQAEQIADTAAKADHAVDSSHDHVELDVLTEPASLVESPVVRALLSLARRELVTELRVEDITRTTDVYGGSYYYIEGQDAEQWILAKAKAKEEEAKAKVDVGQWLSEPELPAVVQLDNDPDMRRRRDDTRYAAYAALADSEGQAFADEIFSAMGTLTVDLAAWRGQYVDKVATANTYEMSYEEIASGECRNCGQNFIFEYTAREHRCQVTR